MSHSHNYLFSNNITINDELLTEIWNWAFGEHNYRIDSSKIFNYLFKTDASDTIKFRLITAHLLLIYYNLFSNILLI